MLRITFVKNPNATTMRLEGRLTGPWVEELDRVWKTTLAQPPNGAISVDLSDLTFVSEEGKKLLGQMYSQGAKLKTSRCATHSIVEELGHSFTK